MRVICFAFYNKSIKTSVIKEILFRNKSIINLYHNLVQLIAYFGSIIDIQTTTKQSFVDTEDY
jgi:hypothetical protein